MALIIIHKDFEETLPECMDLMNDHFGDLQEVTELARPDVGQKTYFVNSKEHTDNEILSITFKEVRGKPKMYYD